MRHEQTYHGALRELERARAARIDEERRLRAEGWSYRKIAAHLGVSHVTVISDLQGSGAPGVAEGMENTDRKTRANSKHSTECAAAQGGE